MLKNNEEYLADVYQKIKQKEKEKKTEKRFHLKPVLTIFLGIIAASILSITVYASMGGTINGKPILEWMGIRFSDEYENYFVPTSGQYLQAEGATLELKGSVCDEGFVVLQFNLNLDENAIAKLKEVINGNTNANLADLEFDIAFNTEQQDELPNNYNVIIDGEEKWIRPRSVQQIEKVTDQQYKVYQMHFLTEKELGEKTDFTLTISNAILKNWDTGSYITFKGKLDIPLTKDPVRNHTEVIEQEEQETSYKNMTTKIEKVSVSPIQTIIKLTSVREDVSLASLENTRHPDYIPIKEYEVRNENGEIIPCISYETKREIHYADGTVEQWEQGDIGTAKEFYGATMVLTEYIAFETIPDSESVSIVPFTSTDEKENGEWVRKQNYVFSNNLIINLKNNSIN